MPLTFEQKVQAAYLHFCKGLDQHILADVYGVNQGRINEACVAVRRALKPEENHDQNRPPAAG